MDAGGHAHYMRPIAMELLLLLSAFMAALTGAIGGERPARSVAQEQVVAVWSGNVVRAARTGGTRPVQSWPARARVGSPHQRPLLFAATVPTFGQRRRE
jgi:hypothetical protein